MQVRLLHNGKRILIDVVEIDEATNMLQCDYTYNGNKYQAKADGITRVANMIKRQISEVDNKNG